MRARRPPVQVNAHAERMPLSRHTPRTQPRGRQSLQRHLGIRLTAILFCTFLASAGLMAFVVQPAILRDQSERNSWYAYFVGQATEALLSQQLEVIRATADALETMEESHFGLDGLEVRTFLKKTVAQEKMMDGILVLNAEGKVLFTDPRHQAYEGLDMSGKSWFSQDMEQNRPYWSSVQFASISSRPVTACLIRKEKRIYVGINSLEQLNGLIRGMDMPEGTHLHLFDQDNRTVIGHDLEEVYTQSYSIHLPPDGFDGEHGHYEVVDPERGAHFAEYHRLPQSGWTVVVMTTHQTVTKIVHEMLLVISLFLGVVILSMLWVIWRSNRKWIGELDAISRSLHGTMTHLPADLGGNEPSLMFTNFDPLIRDFNELMDAAHISEEEAREKAEEAEQANQAKNRFIRNISQEIRNPLGGILGSADLLLFRETDPEKRERLRLLRQSAELLRQTMDDVLDIAYLEAGRLVMAEAAFDIGRLMEDLVLQYAEIAEKKGLSLTMRWDRNLPARVLGDATRIRQVLFNLLENAVKFTDEGVIRLVAQQEAVEDKHVRVRFAVQDTGSGIPRKEWDEVFKDFHQGEAAQGQGRTKGTGLGLSVCARLVAAMGGEIGFDSEVDQGSFFWFVIPLRMAQEGEHEK